MFWWKTLRFWKTILVLCVITYLSLTRDPHVSIPSFTGADKLAHLLMYMLLSFVVLWDIQSLRISIFWKAIIALVFSSIFGGFIEIIQEFFFYPRTGDWIDWVADCIGAIIGLLLCKVIIMIKDARRVVK